MKAIILKPITAFCLMLLLFASSCKKENIPINRPELVGIWSHVQPVGSFRDILTQIELKADGTANEQIMSITTSSTTVMSERNLSWETENDNELILKEEGESDEKFTFTIDEANQELALTNVLSGTTKTFFKNE